MKRNAKSVFVFDLDNTLADTFAVWGESFDRALSDLSAATDHGKEVLIDAINENLPEKYRNSPAVVPGKDMEETFSWITHILPETQTDGIIRAWEQAQTAAFSGGTLSCLERIRKAGAKSVIFTDAPVSATLVFLDRAGFDFSLLAGIWCMPDALPDGTAVTLTPAKRAASIKKRIGDKVRVLPHTAAKPAPAAFGLIGLEMNAAKSDMVMIGDSLLTDGESARAADIDFILLPFEKKKHPLSCRLHKHFARKRASWEKSPPTSAVDFAHITVSSLEEIFDHVTPVSS